MPTGISPNYYSFIQYLKRHKQKFAFLQLTGRMEDMLVKEFAHHIWKESGKSRYPMTNVGNKGEQKFDIIVLRGALKEKKGESESSCEVCTLIEAKYLQRRHRAWEFNANDETKASLKELHRQLKKFKQPKHYDFPVSLQARKRDVYGLVIASYVAAERDDQPRGTSEKELFFTDIKNQATGLGFRYLDLPSPDLNKVYDDVEVNLLGGKRYSSLRVGLWKLK